jgi:drug/metabolite transporter (DMT)-like permease
MNYALLVVVWLSWGLSYPIMAVALQGFDVWTCRAIIMVLGGTALLLLAVARGKSLRVPRALWRDLVIAALCNMTIFQIGMTYGVWLMSAGRTAVLIYTMPIWATLFGRLVLGEKLSAAKLGGLGLGIAGIAVLLSQNLSSLRNAPVGAALILIAAMSFGFGTVWTKRRRWTIDVIVMAGWQVVLGAIPLVAVWAVLAGAGLLDRPVDFAAIPGTSWLALLYLSLIANSLAYIAWFRVVRAFSATVSGLGTLAVPCVGLVGSALILGERLTPFDVAALGCVCAALVLVLVEHRLGSPPRHSAVAPPGPRSSV